jgi:hypothetical protein
MPANWTTPATWTTGQLVSASDLNTQVRDNLEYLKERTDTPASAQYVLNETANYSTTSTAFVDVDATKLVFTLVTRGNPVLVGFYGTVATAASAEAPIYFDVMLDGVRLGTDDGIVMCQRNGSTTGSMALDSVSFVHFIPTLVAGSHTFKLQWKAGVNGAILYAGAATSGRDLHPQFWVREI